MTTSTTLSVAVVIPCRDDAPYLRACLAALAAQTRPADRVVVVDNDSSDDSAAVARAFGATVVTQPVHGIWPATAAGYDAVTEDVVVRLDADSLPGPTWLAHAVDRFSAPDAPDFLAGRGRFYGPRRWVNVLGDHLYLGGMYTWVGPYLGHAPLYGSNLAMRREAWEQVRGLVHRDDPTVHDDLDLSFAVRPWMTVERDDDWWVGVSARPFDSWGALGRRLGRVVATMRAGAPETRWLHHRRERARWRAEHEQALRG